MVMGPKSSVAALKIALIKPLRMVSASSMVLRSSAAPTHTAPIKPLREGSASIMEPSTKNALHCGREPVTMN